MPLFNAFEVLSKEVHLEESVQQEVTPGKSASIYRENVPIILLIIYDYIEKGCMTYF